jgi:hypothetical protein
MHRNHRRKSGKHNPKKEGRGWTMVPPSLVKYRRAYWQEQRAKIRELMVHEKYDAIQNRNLASILWDVL